MFPNSFFHSFRLQTCSMAIRIQSTYKMNMHFESCLRCQTRLKLDLFFKLPCVKLISQLLLKCAMASLILQPRKSEKKETSQSPEIIHDKTLENTACENCCSGLANLIETGDSRRCPGNEYCQPIEYCGHGVRKALNGPFQIKSKSFYGQEKKMIDEDYVTRKQSIDYPLTMPELKKMRQTNISIVRRTRRASKPERQNEKCISSSSNVVPDWGSLRVETKYNPAYEPDDNDTFTSTPTTQTEKSLDKNVANRKCELNKTTVQRKFYSKENKILNGKANNSGSNQQFLFLGHLLSTKSHKSNENVSLEKKESSILQQLPTRQIHQESSGNELVRVNVLVVL